MNHEPAHGASRTPLQALVHTTSASALKRIVSSGDSLRHGRQREPAPLRRALSQGAWLKPQGLRPSPVQLLASCEVTPPSGCTCTPSSWPDLALRTWLDLAAALHAEAWIHGQGERLHADTDDMRLLRARSERSAYGGDRRRSNAIPTPTNLRLFSRLQSVMASPSCAGRAATAPTSALPCGRVRIATCHARYTR